MFASGGFGAKKSTGKGAFTIESFELFDSIEEPNGFVSLSHFIPAQADPTDGCYKTTVKYGKLGEEKTFCGNPFKKPLLMLKPGSVFRTDAAKPWYGKLIENIAPADPNVVQYAYAFSVPVRLTR